MSEGRESITVSTPLATVRGNIRRLNNVSVVHEYLGIPFCEPPVGKRRFRRPVPLSGQRTSGHIDATYRRPSPWQNAFPGTPEMFKVTGEMDEDCLYINLWTPGGSGTTRFPVFVWIYGGAFLSGTANMDLYDGGYLSSEGQVVVVSFNYRLGPLGFLYLGTDEAPGNQALWDQNLALRWVQENIEHFGGDPGNVTIGGESAGAISVACHLLSPYSSSLFHRAIFQSGSALNWSVLSATDAIQRSMAFVKTVLPPSTLPDSASMQEVITHLEKIPVAKIAQSPGIDEGFMQLTWLPMIDSDFLPDDPEKLLSNRLFKRCPVITGTNKDEGSAILLVFTPELNEINPCQMWTKEEFDPFIEKLFRFNPYYPHRRNAEDLCAISHHYFPFSNPNGEMVRARLTQAVGDVSFINDSIQWARAYAETECPTYCYEFVYRAANSCYPAWVGATHGDEMMFLFGLPLRPNGTFSEEDKKVSHKIIQLWTDFIKTGKCDENIWSCFNPSNPKRLHLDANPAMQTSDVAVETQQFWKNL